MKKAFGSILAVAACALASRAVAYTPSLSVGDPPSGQANAGTGYTVPTTLIDLSNPANATGNLTQATFGWGSGSCTNVVTIKVFHRTGSTVTMTGQRGPFNSGSDDGHNNHTVTLSPPLPIQQGDLIGMGIVGSCGYAVSMVGIVGQSFLAYSSDVTGSVSLSSPTYQGGGILRLGATGTATEYTALVIPGVGSTAGGFGAQFHTSLQIVAPPFGSGVSGRLVYHPAGVSGSNSDPSLPLTIATGDAVSWDDVVETMGQTGLGSLDIVLSSSSSVPIVFARVFNDAGANGTSGLGEPPVDVTVAAYSSGSDVVTGGCTGFLSAPIDPTHFRLNIGIRSLSSDSYVSFTLKDANGNVRASASQTLQPNEFVQVAATDLFGLAPGANDYITVSVSGGAAIVYGATTDNTTNDPSAQFVVPMFCIA